MKKTNLLALTLVVLSPLFLHAEVADFDQLSESDVKLGPSKGADGSAVTLSPDRPHTGKQSLKLIYNIQPGNGYAEFIFNESNSLPKFSSAGAWKISFWVRGDAAIKAGPCGLRLIDAMGEVFQYELKDLDPVLRKPEWTKYETQIDLANGSNSHWGPNSDGVADVPLRFHSIALNGGADGDAGTIYIDDLAFESAAK